MSQISIRKTLTVSALAIAASIGFATADDYRVVPQSKLYGGVDGARAAHDRFGERRAERRDGHCETYVSLDYGDTLSDLAEYCDVPVAAILDANPQIPHPRYVPVGEVIRIPDVYGDIYEGRRSLSYHGRQYTHDYLPAGALEEDNQGRIYYRVRRGDTLGQISQSYDVPLRVVASLNPHARPRDLAIGDRIYLPDYAAEAPRSRRDGWRRAGYNDRQDPLVSIYPNTGPRDGEIAIVGDGFEAGGSVAIYLGRGEGEATRVRVVDADGDGRIHETVRLPATWSHEEAYWAARPHDRGDLVRSESYKVAGDWRGDDPSYRDQRRGSDTDLDVIEKPHGSGEVALVATGFPPESNVDFYAGEEADDLTLIARAKSNFRGEAKIETRLPDEVRDRRTHFLATSDDRVVGRSEARAVEVFGRGDDRGYRDHDPLRDAALRENPSTSFFGRVDRRARDLLAARDFVEGPTLVLATGIPGREARRETVVGIVLEREGRCAYLRDDTGGVRRLAGKLDGYGPGDRIIVRGIDDGDTAGCGNGAIRVADADWAPR